MPERRSYTFNPDNVTWTVDDGDTLKVHFVGTDHPLVFRRGEDEALYVGARDALRNAAFTDIRPAMPASRETA